MFHNDYFIATVTLGLALAATAVPAQAKTDQYYGRWTVSDDKPAFSAKGKFYRTIDIAPCGNDFCGVTVEASNTCGPTLFRFLTTHAIEEELTGHGRWGDTKKKLQLGYVRSPDIHPYVYLALGADDMDVSGREGSVPTFEANYKNLGEATCFAK